MTYTPLPVLYEDENFIAVHKPHDLLVHKSKISTDRISAVQIVREMTSCQVDPIHRIDRATSGVLLFGKNKESTKFASDQFMNHEVSKTYLAIVRGWPTEDTGQVNNALKNEKGVEQEAHTEYEVLAKIDYPESIGKYKSSWFSLIRAFPKTGRMHQVRRHLKRLCGPVIGDTQRGSGKHNTFFREKFNSHNLLLFAESLNFKNMNDEEVYIKADLPDSLRNIMNQFNWTLSREL